MTNADRIEKKATFKAPIERVWKAISDSKEFGSWFGMRFDEPFVAGKESVGFITPTTVDAEVAKLQEPHKGARAVFAVDRIEPMTHFSFKWHPFAIDKNHDYSKEPMTTITFTLRALENGTELTITETGFEGLPLERRAEAFAANDGGWAHQCVLLGKYLDHVAG